MKIEQRILGKTGLSVSVLGFGGAEIGFNEVDAKQVSLQLNKALDNGLNLIDTAAAYLKSEELLGAAVGHRRKDYTLVTKCGAIDGFARSDWSKEGILRTIQQSLKNLKTDHVDVLLLHSCAEMEMSWGEAVLGLEAARDRGYTRFIGYSGDGSPALWAVRSGKFDVLETSLNIADQEAITLTLPTAKKANLGVIIKRPIANAVWNSATEPTNDYHQEYWRRIQKLQFPWLNNPKLAVKQALLFTLSQPGVHCAIVGSTKPERWAENSSYLAEGMLAPGEINAIQKRWQEVATPEWVGQI